MSKNFLIKNEHRARLVRKLIIIILCTQKKSLAENYHFNWSSLQALWDSFLLTGHKYQQNISFEVLVTQPVITKTKNQISRPETSFELESHNSRRHWSLKQLGLYVSSKTATTAKRPGKSCKL